MTYDMWAPLLPTPEIVRHVVEHFPDKMLGYLRVFGKRAPTREQVAQLRAVEQGVEDVVAALDAAGLTRTLISGFDEASSAGVTLMPNDLIAPIAERYPDRFIPFAGADVLKGMEAVRELEHWVKDRGFRGLSLRPFMIGLNTLYYGVCTCSYFLQCIVDFIDGCSTIYTWLSLTK